MRACLALTPAALVGRIVDLAPRRAALDLDVLGSELLRCPRRAGACDAAFGYLHRHGGDYGYEYAEPSHFT